ncbi:MAG: flagellar hook-length control protein FliK [Azovibrio sp.]|uniref:flagellar hook-length control protein FliK n=1 Tax=Azovibrio sp. TaxID=1872673 RepID=UPI003C7964B2
MIPPDVASRMRLVNDLVSQPVAPTQKLTDALSDFVPGQRVMATIQALLPNGTYRAMIAQRDITLALPFAAKTGDTLELEVVESNGKLALATAIGKQLAPADADGNASVSTRLTTTGRLIADLLAGMDKAGGKRPEPAPLNNAQPVIDKFPANSADLVPALKTALARSGMFYEAHQARWVQGQMSTESLLQEPQGRLSPAAQMLGQQAIDNPGRSALPNTPSAQNPAPSAPLPAGQQAIDSQGRAVLALNNLPPAQNQASMAATPSAPVQVSMAQVIAPDLAPLVQQQLEALATNTYVWQGQIWPGQNMEWEIIEEDDPRNRKEENVASSWRTQLRLKLPRLGGIEATLRLAGGQNVEISLRTEDPLTRQKLSAANQPLLQQFEALGITLKSFTVAHHVKPEE